MDIIIQDPREFEVMQHKFKVHIFRCRITFSVH